MQKSEFLERIGKGKHISDAEYKVIETVYQWHPCIGNVSGKDDVAALYNGFGMAIFHDMIPRAEKNRELENRLRHAQAEVEQIKEEMKKLAWNNALESDDKKHPKQIKKKQLKYLLEIMEQILGDYESRTARERERIKLVLVRKIDEKLNL